MIFSHQPWRMRLYKKIILMMVTVLAGMVSLDLEKAYNTVWIYGLLYKLISLQLPPYLCILCAFLMGCSFSVQLNDAFSTPKNTSAGLSQGAVLSISLFAIYISDIPHPSNTQLALYADDTALFTQSWHTDTTARRLTSAMNILHRYFTKWKLRVNVNKTKAILFTKCRPAAPPLSQFQHTAIPWSPHIRYLSLVLDSKLLFTKHLHTVNAKPLVCSSNFSPSWPATQRYPSLINSFCTNYVIALYSHTLPVWSNTSSYNYRQLQISQSKCLCIIGNFPRRTPIPRLHTTLNITPIHNFIYHLTANFFDRCSAHPNPLIHSIGNYSLVDLHHQYKKYIHKHPKHILF